MAVLLATYNGGRFLGEQFASLWAQTTQDFIVLVRDDGSSDTTAEILADEARRRPGRVFILNDGATRMGPSRSFARLLEQCDADYIAFCDQDDVWEKEKLERFRDAIRRVEAKSAVGLPVLCCSDVTVTNDELQVTADSYFRKHSIAPTADGMPLARLVFRNFAIGASTMINRALRDAALPLPERAIMHDWWLVLVAQSVGQVIVLPGRSMLYRQHGGNAVGSRRRSWPRSMSQFHADWTWSRTSAANCIRQASVLYERYGERISAQDRALLARFQAFPSCGPLRRLLIMVRSRAFKPSLPLNVLHLLACATAKI